MTVKLTPQMVLAGRAVIEANALQFYESAKDETAWLWFLSLIYNAMRAHEPPPPGDHPEHHPELLPKKAPKAGK